MDSLNSKASETRRDCGMRRPRNFRIPEDTDNKLLALANATGKNLTETIVWCIESTSRRYLTHEHGCSFLICLSNGFHCAISAPEQIKLGNGGFEDADKICTACGKISETVKGA